MALEDESTQDCNGIHERMSEECCDGEDILERQRFLQESRTDIQEVAIENQEEETNIEDTEENEPLQGERKVDESKRMTNYRSGTIDSENQAGPSGFGQSVSRQNDGNGGNGLSALGRCGSQMQGNESGEEDSAARLERYGNYLERYGPQLERYGSQLERFGNQLERIGPQLERCGSNLERYGPQLEAIGRQMVRPSVPQAENCTPEQGPRSQQHGITSLQTQTESGNEGFAPQSADSCQGSSTLNPPNRQGQWMNAPNPRRLSRRPSFQVNDGLVRHWIRRRNMDSRDILPFNRFREDRRRSLWRNESDLRDFRRLRASWRYQDNLFNRQQQADNGRENHQNDENLQVRLGRAQPNDQENGGMIQQDHVRAPRNDALHQDDPDFGFVILDQRNSPGPSRSDTPPFPTRRPRSNMSLRPLSVFNPPILGPIAEYNAESDEENNDQRQDGFGRQAVRAREGGVIRSWVMMSNYFQTRPLFIGQGDSKAMDGPFTLQRIPQDDHIYNGNERNLDLPRVQRPIQRNQRAERRQQRQQLAFQALA